MSAEEQNRSNFFKCIAWSVLCLMLGAIATLLGVSLLEDTRSGEKVFGADLIGPYDGYLMPAPYSQSSDDDMGDDARRSGPGSSLDLQYSLETDVTACCVSPSSSPLTLAYASY